MVIQGEFFRLTPTSEHSTSFDVELLYKIKGKNSREEFKIAGYGVPLDSAIRKCIQYGLSNRFEVLTLKEYLAEYKKMAEEIGLQLKQSSIQISIAK